MLNALSNRISAVVGGTGSVTSAEAQAVSAQAASALSDAISAGQATASQIVNASTVGSLAAISLFNVVSTRTSVGGATSTKGLQSGFANLSAQIAQVNSAYVNASTAGSIAALSLASIQANNVSIAAANASTAGSMAAISLLSIQINTVSAQVASISAQLGTPQLVHTTGSQGFSATNFAPITGLTLSLAANAMYQVDGRVLWHCSTVTGTMFGFSYPGTNNVVLGQMQMQCLVTVMAAGPAGSIYTSAIYPVGNMQAAQMSTVVCTNFSATAISATTLMLEIMGMVNTNSAGNIVFNGKQSATGGGAYTETGSYLRAFRIT